MRNTYSRGMLAAALMACALAACDRADMAAANREGEDIGRKANRLLEQGKEKITAAGHEVAQDLRGNGTAATPAANPQGATAPGDTGGRLGDAAITASIKADYLKDPDLSVLKIDVDTRDGVVTLNGLAENDAARQRAERLAQGIKGVKEVRNYLVVKRV